MAQHAWLDPGPFSFAGGDVGVLLVHGLSGAPVEMRPIGEHLAAEGRSVVGVCVAGHGSSVDELRRTTWSDWYASVESAYAELATRCERVVVAGLSTGALLGLLLCVSRPKIAGLVCMAPALEVRAPFLGATRWLRHVVKDWDKREEATNDLADKESFSRIWSYDVFPLHAVYELSRLQREVRPRLPEVRQPLLVLQGRRDRVISFRGVRRLLREVGSPEPELVWLDESGHTLTVDRERFTAAGHISRFIDERC